MKRNLGKQVMLEEHIFWGGGRIGGWVVDLENLLVGDSLVEQNLKLYDGCWGVAFVGILGCQRISVCQRNLGNQIVKNNQRMDLGCSETRMP